MTDLLTFTESGIYCPPGDFYIDPWRPVKRAVITHAHSDHARWGSAHYLCHHYTRPLLLQRLGEGTAVQSVEFNAPIYHNGVKISLHPAGHIIGSAQVRVEYNGTVWVVSGDYKLEDDSLSTPFEPVPCDTFITESTFALPIYRWKEQAVILNDIRKWIGENREAGKNSVLIAYSLGKAQRLVCHLAGGTGEIFVHGAVYNIHETLRQAGWHLPEVRLVEAGLSPRTYLDGVIIAPPSAASNAAWLHKLEPYSLGICSGWMQVRGNVRRQNADAGFALSDHADWPGLLEAVRATGARQVLVTHGFSNPFARFLSENGWTARAMETAYGNGEEG